VSPIFKKQTLRFRSYLFPSSGSFENVGLVLNTGDNKKSPYSCKSIVKYVHVTLNTCLKNFVLGHDGAYGMHTQSSFVFFWSTG